MAKFTLDNVASGYNRSKINNNFVELQSQLQNNVLYRDNPSGEPNQMEDDIDMNSNDIANANDIYTTRLKIADKWVVAEEETSARDADTVTYDNATSGLTATDVQAAIDEIDTAIDNLQVADLSGLKAIDTSSIADNTEARITSTGRIGNFKWDSSDLSAKVTDDPQEGIYVAPTGGDGSTGAWIRDITNGVSVTAFGASPDIADNATAFQAAADAIKGDDAAGDNNLFSKLIIPYPGSEKTYVLKDSVVIDGTHSTYIVADSPLTSRTADGDSNWIISWDGANTKPVFQIKGQASTTSNPNFFVALHNIGVLGRAVQSNTASTDCALAGFYVGALSGDTNNVVNRNIVLVNCSATNCRFGLYSGSPEDNNTDTAPLSIVDCLFERNYQVGVWAGTGNTIANMTRGKILNNGYSPTTFASDDYNPGQVGANTVCEAGQLRISQYTSAGAGSSKPVDGDIIQLSGSVSVDGAWSDTEGLFLDQRGGTDNGSGGYQVGVLTSIRHYNGTFTAGNTPDSFKIQVPGTVLSSINCYGNIELVSGLSGRPVLSGINFIRSGATFTGTGITSESSLTALSMVGNRSQHWFGGGGSRAFEGLNDVPSTFVINGQSFVEVKGADSGDSGYVISEPFGANGDFYIYVNCYAFSGTFNVRAFKAGDAAIYQIGPSGFTYFTYTFADTTTTVSVSSFDREFGITKTGIFLLDGVGEPATTSGRAWLYVDTADGDLKVKFGDGTIKTIATDT